ncbi:MAG: RDD family protein [archaeon]|nr:RDD family protein [archaeon]
MSGQKVFWKSALKASVLLWFLTGAIFTVVVYLNLGALFSEVLPALRAGAFTRASLESLQPIMIFLTFLCVFSWVGFAFIYDRIPLKWGLLKVFAFDAVLSAITFFLIKTQPIVMLLIGPFYEAFANPAFMIVYLAAWSIAYWWLFEFFKKQENDAFGREAIPAPIQKRIIAYVIDEIFLGIVAFAVFILAIIMAIGKGLVLDRLDLGGALSLAGMNFLNILMAVVLFGFLLRCFYFTVIEARFGASLGKQFMKIRVATENGEKIGLQEAFFRNAPKFVPGLDTFLLLEILFIIQSKKQQRLFDRVAETVVVSAGK